MPNNQKSQNKKESVFSLVLKAKEGDESAFGELYECYVVPIFRYIYFRVKKQEDAEDITQTVFLKAWWAMPSFSIKNDSISNSQKQNCLFSSWLYRIAKNTIIDFWKKKKEIILDDSILEKKDDSGTDFLDKIEEEQKIEAICEIIKELSEDQQEIIILKFINDLSNKEIAEIVNKSEDAVRALQCRGLKALRDKLKDSKLI